MEGFAQTTRICMEDREGVSCVSCGVMWAVMMNGRFDVSDRVSFPKFVVKGGSFQTKRQWLQLYYYLDRHCGQGSTERHRQATVHQRTVGSFLSRTAACRQLTLRLSFQTLLCKQLLSTPYNRLAN